VDFAYEHGLVKPGTQVRCFLSSFSFHRSLPSLSSREQQAADLAATLAICQAEIDKHTDLATMPINMNHCGEVMSQVTEPFVQEFVFSRRVAASSPQKLTCTSLYPVSTVEKSA